MKEKLNKSQKKRILFSVLFAMLFWLPAKISAQEAQEIHISNPETPFILQAESTTYTPLVGGTAVTAINVDNAVTDALPIGFTYTIGCKDYTTFYASSNGMISIGSPIYSATTTPPSTGALFAALAADLSGVGGAFSYKTEGAAPNRVLTAEWKNWKWMYNAAGPVISFQVKIYEGTNNVEYIYNQETTDPTGSSAYIGVAYNNYNSFVNTDQFKKLWLNDSGTNPGTSTTTATAISSRPASGQLYRFVNTDVCSLYGQTLINGPGGMLADGSDGIRINLSATGNMQIRRRWNAVGSRFQIYGSTSDIIWGTKFPYNVPGTLHGLVLSIGNTSYSGGTLVGDANRNRLYPVSTTQQSLVEKSPGHFESVLVMSAAKNGMTYLLEVKYTYNYPETNFLIDYKVTIPAGNTEKVQLAHGWDTYLDGGDSGPGFVNGTAPNLVMGVTKAPSYQAFQYQGGVVWSGYYSAYYNSLNSNLQSSSPNPWMAFDNTIDTNVVDNGIGISMDFGSTPGTFTSNNAVIFQCAAGDYAPTLSSATVKPCAGTNFNLNSYVTSTLPAGVVLQWKKNGVVVADPINVSAAGVYTVSYFSSAYSCSSPEATLTVTLDNTCAVCYKPPVTTGTAEPTKTIISTLDRVAVPRNMSDPRAGSLILESKTRGLVLTRVASPETAITNPVEGMIVYDTVNKVIKLYNGATWHAMTQQGCPD